MSEKITAVTVTGGPLILKRGIVELDADQAKRRAHALRPIDRAGAAGRGLYEIRIEVHFKEGERLGWMGDVPKPLLDFLQPVRRSAVTTAARAAAAVGSAVFNTTHAPA